MIAAATEFHSMAGEPPRNSKAPDEDPGDEADRQTASLAALAVILLLLVLGLGLLHVLQSKSATEDCLMAGYRNCDATTGVVSPHS
jgi:hypothetical protein